MNQIDIEMKKIRTITKKLKDENEIIERRYESIKCRTFMCPNPISHILVTGLGRYPNYCESYLCNKCSDRIQKLSDYQWDVLGIIDVMRI